ncbi:MAG: hypothetical protein FJW14_19025 [Acidimicrobiia bacterium]|nr:hypothetical protein [Acidimicrobiia bacterium]
MATLTWHARDADDVLAALGSTAEGLSSDEAARRLAQHGPNRLPPPQRAARLRILLDQLKSVVVLLLIAATAVSLLLGDTAEAAAIAITLSTLAAYRWALEAAPDRATSIAFMALALAQIGHLGNARSAGAVVARERILANRYAIAAVALSVALQAAAAVVEPLARLLAVAALTAGDWVMVVGFASIPALAGQALKLVSARR